MSPSHRTKKGYPCADCGAVRSNAKRERCRKCEGARRSRLALEQALTNHVVDPVSGCWICQGAQSDDGYCSITLDGKQMPAHRAVYLVKVGPIPDGYEVDHTCRTRPCIRPDHLEAVPPLVNKERSMVARRDNRCRRGHLMTPENTYTLRRTDGRVSTSCKACVLAGNRRRREAAKAA